MRSVKIAILGALLAVAGSAWASWTPALNTSWQWQLQGTINPNLNVQMYDIDLFDNSAATIASLHATGKVVICYFSAGSWEDWRPDAGAFPASVKGRSNGWPGEKWLDIRNIGVLGPIMKARLDLAVTKGCDGVEGDNIDGYSNRSGFPLSYQDQLAYNKFLAAEAHGRNLAIALKNDGEQVKDLVGHFDFAIVEQCAEYRECGLWKPFVAAGKAVFQVEYRGSLSSFCPAANAANFNAIKKKESLGVYREACRGQ